MGEESKLAPFEKDVGDYGRAEAKEIDKFLAKVNADQVNGTFTDSNDENYYGLSCSETQLKLDMIERPRLYRKSFESKSIGPLQAIFLAR